MMGNRTIAHLLIGVGLAALVGLFRPAPVSGQQPKARPALDSLSHPRSMTFSPDGKTLAVGCFDKSIRLWDPATGKITAVLAGHDDEVCAVAFSPDGKTLASSAHKTIKLWDAKGGKNISTFKVVTPTDYYGWSLSFSPDGKTLASGGGSLDPNEENTLILWDTASGKETASLKGHGRTVHAVAYSPDGKTLASGGSDKTIRLWDVATGKSTLVLKGHAKGVMSVAFSPDGKILASAGGEDGTVKLWDTAGGKNTATIKGYDDYLTSVGFSPDGKTLATAGGDGEDDKKVSSVKLWDTAGGKSIAKLTGFTSRMESVWCLAFSPDGKTLASGSGRTLLLWETAAMKIPDK